LLDPIANQLAAQGVSRVCSNPGQSAMAAIGRHTPDLVIVDSGAESDARMICYPALINCLSSDARK
jgi:DNA-binding response OmpR family regulator